MTEESTPTPAPLPEPAGGSANDKGDIAIPEIGDEPSAIGSPDDTSLWHHILGATAAKALSTWFFSLNRWVKIGAVAGVILLVTSFCWIGGNLFRPQPTTPPTETPPTSIPTFSLGGTVNECLIDPVTGQKTNCPTEPIHATPTSCLIDPATGGCANNDPERFTVSSSVGTNKYVWTDSTGIHLLYPQEKRGEGVKNPYNFRGRWFYYALGHSNATGKEWPAELEQSADEGGLYACLWLSYIKSHSDEIEVVVPWDTYLNCGGQ